MVPSLTPHLSPPLIRGNSPTGFCSWIKGWLVGYIAGEMGTFVPFTKKTWDIRSVTAPNQKSFFSPYLHSRLTCRAPRWILGVDTPMLKLAIIEATFKA
ncbi:hypothetical protein SLEP1_g22798 [Rubroshorea leprosula]|uniref:Uncharacterized protein n=1 Tax=Rubroshorea leprosula TaxID=152421 RepID=A0AAV5JL84_9ROSI|nr:hypothetical protein SLEP1_g22798 [Rubroshorea leprosula]